MPTRKPLDKQLRAKLRELGHKDLAERVVKVTGFKKRGATPRTPDRYMMVEVAYREWIEPTPSHLTVRGYIGGYWATLQTKEFRTPRNLTEAATVLLLVV